MSPEARMSRDEWMTRDGGIRPERRIKLFVTDIDGCLAIPFEPFRIGKLRRLRRESRPSLDADSDYPLISLCSGRSYSYVEAMSQLLAIRAPALFEGGAGMIDTTTMNPSWNPTLESAMLAGLEAVRSFFEREVVPRYDVWLDREKRTQVGLMGSPESVTAAVPTARDFVTAGYPGLLFATTKYSIDVLPGSLSKRQGLEWLAAVTGVDLDAMAFVGDSDGDLGAIDIAGVGFAPANAAEVVQERADLVTKGSDIDGVLEAYRWCVEHNRALR
jgi:hypothetical protein